MNNVEFWLACLEGLYLTATNRVADDVANGKSIYGRTEFQDLWESLGGNLTDGYFFWFTWAFQVRYFQIIVPPGEFIEGYEADLVFWSEVNTVRETIPVSERPCPIKSFGFP